MPSSDERHVLDLPFSLISVNTLNSLIKVILAPKQVVLGDLTIAISSKILEKQPDANIVIFRGVTIYLTTPEGKVIIEPAGLRVIAAVFDEVKSLLCEYVAKWKDCEEANKLLHKTLSNLAFNKIQARALYETVPEVFKSHIEECASNAVRSLSTLRGVDAAYHIWDGDNYLRRPKLASLDSQVEYIQKAFPDTLNLFKESAVSYLIFGDL